jgi:hypothetical protein
MCLPWQPVVDGMDWAGRDSPRPDDDLRPHHSETCSCDPSIELHVAGDGYASWRVSHNSFDRRELTEQALHKENRAA